MSDVTQILEELRRSTGDPSAVLLPLVYEELRHLAQQQMGEERSDHTLQATALVHEAYLRLMGNGPVSWDNRRHFFSAAAEAMRRILVEHARRKKATKHGGEANRVSLSEEIPASGFASERPDDILALSEALDQLAMEDPGKAQLVKLRYFAGMSLAEAGEAMGVSRATANRHWVYARAWLLAALRKSNQ